MVSFFKFQNDVLVSFVHKKSMNEERCSFWKYYYSLNFCLFIYFLKLSKSQCCGDAAKSLRVMLASCKSLGSYLGLFTFKPTPCSWPRKSSGTWAKYPLILTWEIQMQPLSSTCRCWILWASREQAGGWKLFLPFLLTVALSK